MAEKVLTSFTVVEKMQDTGIEVIIVGAGIGGLWAALECWRNGHKVRILDKTKGPETNGDFFTLNPAACKAFKHWPQMKAEHEKAACRPSFSCFQCDGTSLLSHERITSQTTDEMGVTVEAELDTWRHLRPKLQQVLLRQLQRIGLSIEYGSCVTGYEETLDKGFVILDDGSRLEAGVVIAADGIGTKSGQMVLGHTLRARSSGSAVYRCAYPVEVLDTDLILSEHFRLYDGEGGASEMWIGPKLHLITTRNTETFSWAMTHRDNGMSSESWHSTSTPCQPADAIKAIENAWGNCPDILKRMIEITPADTLLDFKIMWRDPNPTWTSPLGRVVQLGDAAHTFVPSSGNGANQAIEDAVSLACCLKIAGQQDIPTAVRVHNLLRFERVSCAQITGFQNQANRENAHWDLLASHPESVKPKLGRWIWEHDAEDYANDNYANACQKLLCSAAFGNTNIPPGYKYRPWNIDQLLEMMESGDPIVFDGDWN
ncbi:hypothetical protein N7509_004500 [Penicillium cosmopolitanum]|uniref:FAD-binding domain-containing protein n=1 Tax=Penicillium cosmopolitanum TaxID=1131564 RepID=A0A9W9W6X8_9EURO|nr:uncharacterized protein N7509_004500 [Penicillium cosmopolitanum]KAJ5404629.1 hypothetical protein N7509_004500 [Penicillium cosmopolitanum]